MTMNTKDFGTLVADQAAAVQGSSTKLIDFRIGSVLRAIIEANAAVVLWLQGLVLALLARSRAATSNGTDLDTWVGDYGLTRLPAVAASGLVTFARFTAGAQAVVPVGAVVQTADGSQRYDVTLDTGDARYSAIAGGYVLPIGTLSIQVPVLAETAGAAGNAAAGVISTINQSISGVDTVSNTAQFTNGSDAETDTALRARFVAYINSLSKATRAAIANAVASVGANITTLIVENQTYTGLASPGFFFVVVDDGSGNPPTATLTAATNAIDAVRALGSTFAVYPPVIVTANVALTVVVVSGYDATATKALVSAAISAYINSLPLGSTLALSRIPQVAYDASAGVLNVTGVTVNSGTTDIVPTAVQVVKAGTVTVS